MVCFYSSKWLFRGLLRGVLLARPKVTTFGAGCDPCPGLPRCCASPYCCCSRAARAALRTATGNGNRERAGALNPLSWAAGASAAGRLPCLASPFFGGDSKAACRRLASQLAAHSATMGRSAISHGELAALLVDGEAKAHQQKLKKDVKRLHEWHEMLAKQAKRREDAPSFAAAAQKGSWRSKPFPPCPPPGKNRTF